MGIRFGKEHVGNDLCVTDTGFLFEGRNLYDRVAVVYLQRSC